MFKFLPRIFAPITIGLIEAGEAGGILSEVLDRLALLLEAQSNIKGQITGALIYPIAILVLAVTGILHELTMALIHSATRSGSFIKHAPNIFF